MATYRATRAAILDSMSASYWLKQAVMDLGDRDPVDAVYDAEALLRLMRLRLAEIQRPASDALVAALIAMTKE